MLSLPHFSIFSKIYLQTAGLGGSIALTLVNGELHERDQNLMRNASIQ